MATFQSDAESFISEAKPADKLLYLRNLAEYRSELESARKEADLKEWKAKFDASQKAAIERAKRVEKIYDRWAAGEKDLAVADRRVLASVLRASVGGGRASKNGASSMWREWHTKRFDTADQNVGDPGSYLSTAQIPNQIVDNLKETTGLRLDDPKRPVLTQYALESGVWTPEELREKIGEEAWAAYENGITEEDRGAARASAIIDRVELGEFSRPDLEAIKDAAILATDVKPEDVAMVVSEQSALEKELSEQTKKFLNDIGSTEERGRWYGLTDKQVGEMVERPGFQRWARDHGFTDIGRLNGTEFVPGVQTDKMLRAMYKQRTQPVKNLYGQWSDKVVLDDAAPQKFVIGGTTGNVTNTAWSVNDDGSIDYIDLASGTVTPAKSKTGEWVSIALRDQYGKHLERMPGGAPQVIGIKGQSPMTVRELFERGPLNFGEETALTIDEEELKPRRPVVGEVKGVRRKATFGEDPALNVSLVQDDGTTVHLYRKSEDEPWRVVEGAENAKLFNVKPIKSEQVDEVVVAPMKKAEEPEPVNSPALAKAESEFMDKLDKGEIKAKKVASPTSLTAQGEGEVTIEQPEDEAERLTAKGDGEVTIAEPEPLTPKQMSDIAGRVQARDLGDELEAGGKALVERAGDEAKFAEGVAKDRAKALEAGAERAGLAAMPVRGTTAWRPAVAVAERTTIEPLNSPALAKDESDFMAKLTKKDDERAADALRPKGEGVVKIESEDVEVVDGAEVPVRIKPKGAPALTLDALRRARKGA